MANPGEGEEVGEAVPEEAHAVHACGLQVQQLAPPHVVGPLHLTTTPTLAQFPLSPLPPLTCMVSMPLGKSSSTSR